MRDGILVLIFAVLMLMTIWRPWLGILVWAWIGYMNPHRLCWGFAATFPFAAVTVGVTIPCVLLSRESKRMPWTRETVLLLLLVFWMNVTLLFALNPEGAADGWSKVMKIQFMTFVGLMVISDRLRLNALVWTIVVSLGFFGVKGGLFALVSGGGDHVFGPPGTFIEDNNELAVALVMILPLMRYLQMSADKWWIRMGLVGAQVLTVLAVLATYSRGGLLALVAVGIMLLLSGKKKLRFALVIAVIVPTLLAVLPIKWSDRMKTIGSYEEDASAMGRLNAWRFAYNLAVDRPMTGGGFRSFTPALFRIYAPNPEDHHAAHSIYFEMLGDHGFVGLALFLATGFFTFRKATMVTRSAKQNPEVQWAADLVSMTKVGLVGYAVGGAFVSLAYFDLPYHLLSIIVISSVLVRRTALKGDGEPTLSDTAAA